MIERYEKKVLSGFLWFLLLFYTFILFDCYKFLSFRLFVSPPRVPFFKENVIFPPPCLLSRVDFLLQRELPNFNRCKTKFMDFLLFLLNLENEAWANLELSDLKIVLRLGPLTGQNCNVFAYIIILEDIFFVKPHIPSVPLLWNESEVIQ